MNFKFVLVKFYSFLLILVAFSLNCFAQNQQLCKGNLGENIFKDGDFGRGQEHILPGNPGIAPGYLYVAGLPLDGRYTLAWSTSALKGLFSTWINVGDQMDPNGYIMIVNASFEPGIFYEKKIDSLCPGTLYEFSADVINLVRMNIPNHILPNVSFLIDNQVVFSTGAIHQNERWNKYGFTFSTKPGQTSIRLSLRNNAPGGTGNDLALDNISFRPCNESNIIQIGGKREAILCKENPPLTIPARLSSALPYFIWQKSKDSMRWEEVSNGRFPEYTHSPDTAGTTYYRFFAAANPMDLNNDFCRVYSSNFKVTVPENTFYASDTICENSPYFFGNKKLETSGIFKEVFQSSAGCDSTVFLSLTVIPRYDLKVRKILSNPLCAITKTGTMGIQELSGGTPPYKINLRDEKSNSYPAFNELSSGKYFLEVADRYNCTNLDSFELTDPEVFVADIGNDTTIFLGAALTLNVTANFPVFRTEWNPADMESYPNFTPLQSGIIRLKAYNANGCTATDSIRYTIDKNLPIQYSNILSLNASQPENRLFKWHSEFASTFTVEDFHLFDMYGNVIFKTKEVSGNSIDLGELINRRSGGDIYVFSMRARLLDQSIKYFNGSVIIADQ